MIIFRYVNLCFESTLSCSVFRKLVVRASHGCTALSTVNYNVSQLAPFYPILPSTTDIITHSYPKSAFVSPSSRDITPLLHYSPNPLIYWFITICNHIVPDSQNTCYFISQLHVTHCDSTLK